MGFGPVLPVLLLLMLVAAVALSSLGSRHVQGRAVSLFRALFPSWRFFEDLVHSPHLYCRLGDGKGGFGPWQPCLPRHERGAGALFLNPEGNLLHACHSLVEQLVSDISDWPEDRVDELSGSVSYRLTRDLVRHRIAKDHAAGLPAEFQFKVNAVMQGSPDDRIEDVLLSGTHRMRGD